MGDGSGWEHLLLAQRVGLNSQHPQQMGHNIIPAPGDLTHTLQHHGHRLKYSYPILFNLCMRDQRLEEERQLVKFIELVAFNFGT